MKLNTTQFNIRIPRRMRDDLVREATALGLNVSEYVRRIIDARRAEAARKES